MDKQWMNKQAELSTYVFTFFQLLSSKIDMNTEMGAGNRSD